MKSSFFALLTAAVTAVPVMAFEFTTDCQTGSSVRNTNGVYTIQNGLHLNDDNYASVGHQNAYHVTSYLWAQLPTNYFAAATVVCPVALRGTLKTVNMDIWSIGTMPSIQCPGNIFTDSWHTYDDFSPIVQERSPLLLNGRMPVKVLDNAIKAGDYVGWGAGQFIGTKEFSSGELMKQIALAFYRGASSAEYLVLRFTPDGMAYKDGEFRFAGFSTKTAAEKNSVPDAAKVSAVHIRYDGVEGVSAPVSRLSAAERESDCYIRQSVNWVQYRDSDGTSGFEYPVYCGVKDGKTRDLYFTIDAPAYTLTNAWLTVNALPPFTGDVPAGARVSLSLMGFADDPAANQDFVVTDGMFEGQTPIVLQDNVLRDGVAAGKSLFTRRVGQRDLIRALNARVKALKNVWVDNRRGQKAVFRLAVEAAGGVDDWGFSIGSAATPGVEAFFEGVEYRKRIGIFVNTGFENGLKNWTLSSAWTEEQAAVVEDPVDPSNHCLRFSVTNFTSVSWFQVYQSYSKDVESLRGRPYYISYRVYMPSSAPIMERGEKLEEFGYWLFWGKEVDDSGKVSNKQIEFAKSAIASTQCDKWHEYSTMKILPDNITEILRIYMQFRFGEKDMTANEGDTLYYDDVTVEFEDFYDFPEEETTFMMIVR